jgi:hypothetical protein
MTRIAQGDGPPRRGFELDPQGEEAWRGRPSGGLAPGAHEAMETPPDDRVAIKYVDAPRGGQPPRPQFGLNLVFERVSRLLQVARRYEGGSARPNAGLGELRDGLKPDPREIGLFA